MGKKSALQCLLSTAAGLKLAALQNNSVSFLVNFVKFAKTTIL